MSKITLGLAAALVLGTVAGPANANFLGECKAYMQFVIKTAPEGPQFKTVVDKKFGGDVVEFCACTEDTIKAAPNGDLAGVTADLKALNDAVDDGASTAKLESMASNSTKMGDFLGGVLSCSTPAK
jgi:hypothetical protein